MHLLANWRWLTATTSHFLDALSRQTRLTYLLNASLFGALTLVVLSSLLIAEITVPWLAALDSNHGF